MENRKESKKMDKLKLNKLSKVELDECAMNAIKGGTPCNCMGWHYTIDYWKV